MGKKGKNGKKVGHTKIEVGIHMFLYLSRKIFYNIRECMPYPGTWIKVMWKLMFKFGYSIWDMIRKSVLKPEM